MQRLFVGLGDFEGSLAEYFVDLPSLYHSFEESQITWQKKENLHITLKFIGIANDELINRIKKLLKTVKAKPFSISFTGYGIFTPGNHSVIWSGIEAPKELFTLQRNISKILDFSLDGEIAPTVSNEYTPHLTLARLKRVEKKEIEEFVSTFEKYLTPPYLITHFTLYRSHKALDGSTYYEELERFPLV